jgi:hypothetical protein
MSDERNERTPTDRPSDAVASKSQGKINRRRETLLAADHALVCELSEFERALPAWGGYFIEELANLVEDEATPLTGAQRKRARALIGRSAALAPCSR